MAEVSDLKIKLVGMEKEQSEYEEKQNKAEVRLFGFFFFHPWCAVTHLSFWAESSTEKSGFYEFSVVMDFQDGVSFPLSHYTSEVAVWLSSRPNESGVPSRSIYCCGCSLNPFLSLAAGLT